MRVECIDDFKESLTIGKEYELWRDGVYYGVIDDDGKTQYFTKELFGIYFKEIQMEILRIFKEPDAIWESESVEECISKTEGAGYWKKDTVMAELEKGNLVQTPFAYYKKKGVEDTIEQDLKTKQGENDE